MIHYAFDLSEKYKEPVMMRITTRMAHSRAGVTRKAEVRNQNPLTLPEDKKQYILLPAIARKQYAKLLEKQPLFVKESETAGWNKYFEGSNKKLGIIACGIAYNYLMENYPDRKCPYPIVKVQQYPLPTAMIEKLYNECDEILVLEEGQPLNEQKIRGFMNNGKPVHGRLDGALPRVGELSPNCVGKALGLNIEEGLEIPALVAARPPKLCDGCPHVDSYTALNEAMKSFPGGRVFSDIGCYTLGALPPFEAIYSTVDMGASITMAKGASEATLLPSVAVIGDSTFTHSGMTGLLDCCVDNANITVIILDNEITGMTGSQKSSATGRLESICTGLGVAPEHIRVIKPLKANHEENVRILKEEIGYKGVSVVIPRRECIVAMNKRLKAERAAKEKAAKENK